MSSTKYTKRRIKNQKTNNNTQWSHPKSLRESNKRSAHKNVEKSQAIDTYWLPKCVRIFFGFFFFNVCFQHCAPICLYWEKFEVFTVKYQNNTREKPSSPLPYTCMYRLSKTKNIENKTTTFSSTENEKKCARHSLWLLLLLLEFIR